MRRILILLLTALLLCVRVCAEDELGLVDSEALKSGLSDEAQELLCDVEPTESISFGKTAWSILTDVLSDSGIYLRSSLQTACRLLAVLTLCSAVGGMELAHVSQTVNLAGALAITSVCVLDLRTMIGLAGDTADQISVFSQLLLPTLSAVMTASGGVTSGAALYTGSILFLNLLITLIHQVLIPMTYLYVILAAADAATGQGRLKQMKKLLEWCIGLLLKGVVSIFTAYLTATGLLAGSADAASLKAVKSAISGTIPVVGGIVSGAAGTVLASAEMIKSSVGLFGLLGILATGTMPFVRIGISFLTLKLTAAVSGTIGSESHCGLLGSLSTAMGYMLGMVGSCMVMEWIACCCFMKAVNV